MREIMLGKTGLKVSPFCLGTANYGTGLSGEECEEQMDRFLELGGRFIDTAHVYNDWIPGEKSRAEKIIGRWMQKRGTRDEVVLATKGAHPDMAAMNISRVDPENIKIDLNESLELLQTDYIDIYFLHRDNTSVPVDEILDCLNETIQNGKVRFIGCSNWTLRRIKEAEETAKKNRRRSFDVNQLMWSLARINEAGLPDKYAVMNAEIHAYHTQVQMPVMCFSSQAKGYFPRRLAGEPFKSDMLGVYGLTENDRIFEKLKVISAETGLTMTDLSLRFFSKQPFTAIPIVSCDDMTQLEACVHAFDISCGDIKYPAAF
jgi:aryl-alcohol dehydrogenase-like predicted oxidoreductase